MKQTISKNEVFLLKKVEIYTSILTLTGINHSMEEMHLISKYILSVKLGKFT